jgi:hypothetical protein
MANHGYLDASENSIALMSSRTRHWMHGHITNHHQLVHILGQSRPGSPVSHLFLPEGEMTEEWKRDDDMKIEA